MRKLVYVIGMGPGNFEQMTFEARRALEQSDVIVGYTVYVDLLREHFPEKQFLTTPTVSYTHLTLPTILRV